MEDEIELPVKYKEAEHMLKFKFIVNEFFSVDVNGQTILFDIDEEGNFQAIFYYKDLGNNVNFDVELLKGITGAIVDLVT